MKIILTGEINSGKSTVIKSIIAKNRFDYNGLFSYYLENENKREFYLEDNFGFKNKFAERIFDNKSDTDFKFFPEVFDNYSYIIEKKWDKKKMVMIDELGFMELKCNKFINKLCEFLSYSEIFLIVIQKRVLDNWLDFIKKYDELLILDYFNRNEMANIIFSKLIKNEG